MKTLNDIVFINNLPSLDLHGYDRQTAKVLINDFINENIKLKNEFIVIIHGIGTGILKKETSNVLSLNKNVIDYKIYYFNEGSTIVQIKI